MTIILDIVDRRDFWNTRFRKVDIFPLSYCTVLAVLVRDNRLGHLIVHTFFIPDFTVGIAIALLRTQELSNWLPLDVFPLRRPADHPQITLGVFALRGPANHSLIWLITNSWWRGPASGSLLTNRVEATDLNPSEMHSSGFVTDETLLSNHSA
jgi:hypothetical protein